MTEPSVSAVPGRRYRLTVRSRLALTYSALLTGTGAIMLALIYTFMRFVPTYDLVPASPTLPAVGVEASVPAATLDGLSGVEAAPISIPASDLTISSTDQMLNVLLGVSVIVLVLLALVGVAVGWKVAGRILAPLQEINRVVGQAARGNLQHRIALVGPRDEITDLAANFDQMLAQLEQSFAASKRFASNASHELLTPLSTSRAMLDTALAKAPGPEERVVLERVRIMNERSIETAQALLHLAQIDSAAVRTEPVELSGVAEEVLEFTRELAARKGVHVTADLEPATFLGEPILVRQLVHNLVENAVIHNVVSDGFVAVTTQTDDADKTVKLTITNSGPVMAQDSVASLTEPFARSGTRVSRASGHGLGLSIVSLISERLHGNLELRARADGGLVAVVTFPGFSNADAA